MVELHLHMDGSIPKEIFPDLLRLTGANKKKDEMDILVSMKNGATGLVDYLKCFEEPLRVLQKTDCLVLTTYQLIKNLYKEDINIAELRFAPQLLKLQNLTGEQIVEAVLEGQNKALKECTGMKSGILLCMMVNGTDFDNEETIELCNKYRNQGIIGTDLAGPEGMIPIEHFKPYFQKASKMDIPYTIHAGECKDWNAVTKAIEYGAQRIGHGISAIDSEECLTILSKKQIPLEVCVTSNVQTCAVNSYEEHPIKRLLDMGISVTLNSDNRTVSDTTLAKEIELVKSRCGLTEEDINKMQEIAKKASFIDL